MFISGKGKKKSAKRSHAIYSLTFNSFTNLQKLVPVENCQATYNENWSSNTRELSVSHPSI